MKVSEDIVDRVALAIEGVLGHQVGPNHPVWKTVEEVRAETRMAAIAALNVMATEFGRRGGLKGGPARAAKLSPERRQEIAKMGSEARLGNLKKNDRNRIR